MPELPEVETVLSTLENNIKGKEITDVDILYPNLLVNIETEEFRKRLIGKRFKGFHRRGKFLIFDMGDETLIVHLRMEGKFYLQEKEEDRIKHTHIIFDLKNARQLRYDDVRKFGRFYLYGKEEEKSCLNHLGKEPWDNSLDTNYLLKRFEKLKSLSVKSALLDQSIIAGIGNIYANEICFRCHIHPARKAADISVIEAEKIIEETRNVLDEAIQAGGTTIRSYTSSLGVTGRFQQNLYVHGQSVCRICGNRIEKIKLNGRGTYYCPNCQKYD